jgi:hypothetical protein
MAALTGFALYRPPWTSGCDAVKRSEKRRRGRQHLRVPEPS